MYINLGFINRSIDSAHRHNFKLDRLFEIQGVGIIPQRIFVLSDNKNANTVWFYADYDFADVCTDWQGVYVVDMSCALVDGKRVFGTINGECQRCVFAINLFGILSFNFIFYSKEVMLDSELYSVSTSLSSKQDVIIKAAASRLVMTVKNFIFICKWVYCYKSQK